MEREQQREWLDLQVDVRATLRSDVGGFPPRTRADLVVRLISMPSFLDWQAVELYRVEGEEATGHVVRRTWDVVEDRRAFESPVSRLARPTPYVPTVHVERADIPANEVAEFSAELAALVLPAGPGPHASGVDGTRMELSTGDAFAGVRFHWWSSLPAAWAPLDPVMQRLLDVASRTIG